MLSSGLLCQVLIGLCQNTDKCVVTRIKVQRNFDLPGKTHPYWYQIGSRASQKFRIFERSEFNFCCRDRSDRTQNASETPLNAALDAECRQNEKIARLLSVCSAVFRSPSRLCCWDSLFLYQTCHYLSMKTWKSTKNNNTASVIPYAVQTLQNAPHNAESSTEQLKTALYGQFSQKFRS